MTVSNAPGRWPGWVRRAWALRLLRTHPARALALDDRDPLVLNALGLHAAVWRRLADGPLNSPAERLAYVEAGVAMGQADQALTAARALIGRRRERAALALARARPADALTLTEDPGLRAALLAHLGEPEPSRQVLAGLTGPADSNLWLLAANLALEAGETEGAEAAVARAFVRHGLAPPRRADPTRPMTITNIACPGAAARRVEGPLVSVIMSAFNVAPYVGAAVGSILAQTWRRLELILVDDASTDATAATARAAAAGDPRLRLIRQPRRAGPYAARNLALTEAVGEMVMIHDADDWAHPEKIERQALRLLTGGLAAVSSLQVRLDDEGRFVARQLWPLLRWSAASTLYGRAAIDRAGLFDPVETGADSEYWARMIELFGRKSAVILRQPLTLAAQRGNSLTTSGESGFDGSGVSQARLAYWELWRRRHAATRFV